MRNDLSLFVAKAYTYLRETIYEITNWNCIYGFSCNIDAAVYCLPGCRIGVNLAQLFWFRDVPGKFLCQQGVESGSGRNRIIAYSRRSQCPARTGNVRTKRPVSDLWRNVRNPSASRCISMNSRQMRLATNTLARASKQANPRIAASRQGSPADPPCTAEPNRREQIQVFVDQPAWREHHVDGVRRCP